MSGASQGSACGVCGQALPVGQPDCPSCGASGGWQELIWATDFAQSRFVQWAKGRTIGGGPLEAIAREHAQRRQALIDRAKSGGPLPAEAAVVSPDKCWDCRGALVPAWRHCGGCGVPVHQPLVQELRY